MNDITNVVSAQTHKESGTQNYIKKELLRQEEGSSLKNEESKIIENIFPKVTILTNNKSGIEESNEKEVGVTGIGLRKLLC